MNRPRLETFIAPDGSVRELRDPDGEATGAQLRRLNREGRLELVRRDGADPLTQAAAAAAISEETTT